MSKQVSIFAMRGFRKDQASSANAKEDVTQAVNFNEEFQKHTQELADEMGRVSKAREKWQDDWPERWKWLVNDKEAGLLFCSTCKQDPNCKSLFGTKGSKNFRTSAFDEHARSQAHRDALLLIERDKHGLQKLAKKRKVSVDAVMERIFKCAYFIAKEDLAFRKLISVLDLMRECGVQLPHKYNDNKACARFVLHISRAIEIDIFDRLKQSPWFGVMVDEATDVSSTKNLIMYATFLDGRRVRTCFLGLVSVRDGCAETLTESIFALLKQWDLDIRKFIGFGSDGASVMVGQNTGVATRLKMVNPFMTSLHCCAHRTNLCVEEASKKDTTKTTCKLVDELVNRVASYFSRSTLRQGKLHDVQVALEYSNLQVLGIVKTRWLSRHGAIARVCDAYEPLMKALEADTDGKPIYLSLKEFKIVYILHFLADILKITSNLSLEFQKEYVDVTCIASLSRAAIMEIDEAFSQQNLPDLNGFDKDSKGYPVIPDFGGNDGMLAALRSAVKGHMYRSVEMDRNIDGEDLTFAIEFQTAFAKALTSTLESRLQDQVTLSDLKILSPMNMPSGKQELKVYGVQQIKNIGEFYGNEKKVGARIHPPIVDKGKLCQEFIVFRRQASTEWFGRNFRDIWTMIYYSDTWKDKFPELLKVAIIGLVQCSSTAACERGFSRLNRIKSKFRNRLQTEGTDALLRISMEGPPLEGFDFTMAIKLWKDSAEYRHIYTGCSNEMEEEANIFHDEEDEDDDDMVEEI